ncbi:DUF3632 domain-containing protein [Streptomyces hokutonensis]|uniref:DUF3632 domain-containing protein n=1 Tax=Streptomyces hokutonensis TaxID=1306990 RepID=A0ABW6M5K9_9ACTN
MDDDIASRYYETLLSGYLRTAPTMTTEEAVARFVAPVRSAFVDDQAAESTIEAMLWAAWYQVVLAARTSSGISQEKIVDLLTGIRNLGVLSRDQGRHRCEIWGGLKVFVDLPCFGAEMREEWNIGSDAPGSPDTWANMNAFAARLTAADIDFSLYAIWTLRDCLEEESPVISADLRAAVPWFQHCSALLANLARRRRAFRQGNRGPARLGKLCTDGGMTEGGFTIERWEFWRSRLAGLATGTDPTAQVARAALQYMTALDGRVGQP